MIINKIIKRPLRIAILTIVLIFSCIIWDVGRFVLSGPLEKPITLMYPPNTHFNDIADNLEENHVIRHALIFKAFMYITGQAFTVKAGEYAFPAHISERNVAIMLALGKTVVHHFTVPEGLMTSEILDMVRHNDMLSGEITLDVKEGELLPETYNFSRGDKRNDLIERMRRAMAKTINDAWSGRADNLPLETPGQALTLASIIEKETGLVTERQHVASVYINRLRKKMLLQADPTTAYAVTMGRRKLTRPLTRDDLNLKSPYNTYQSPGLPPGPIDNPGRAAILAALHPMQTDDLYFVATGNGGHYFARTAQEHEANVQKYRAVEDARQIKQ